MWPIVGLWRFRGVARLWDLMILLRFEKIGALIKLSWVYHLGIEKSVASHQQLQLFAPTVVVVDEIWACQKIITCWNKGLADWICLYLGKKMFLCSFQKINEKQQKKLLIFN